LPRWVLASTGLEHLAEDDFVNDAGVRINACSLAQLLDCKYPEVDSGKARKGPKELANWRASNGADGNLGLRHESPNVNLFFNVRDPKSAKNREKP
jgi:hypothetical protein